MPACVRVLKLPSSRSCQVPAAPLMNEAASAASRSPVPSTVATGRPRPTWRAAKRRISGTTPPATMHPMQSARINLPRAMTSAGISANRVEATNSASSSVAVTGSVPCTQCAWFLQRSSSADDRDCADRACRAAADLERETYEPEPALAHQLVKVPQAFHVRNATLGAGHVRLEVGFPLRRRADRLDAEHQDALVREPMHGIDVEPWEVMQVTARPP